MGEFFIKYSNKKAVFLLICKEYVKRYINPIKRHYVKRCHVVRIPCYDIRVLISLLDGSWKTAQQIAEEWHPRGAIDAKPYRKTCKKLVGKLLQKPRIRITKGGKRSKRKDTEFTLDLATTSKFLSNIWNRDSALVDKLLKSKSFQKYASGIDKKSISKQGLFFTLQLLASMYLAQLDVDSATEEDLELILKLLKDWDERYLTRKEEKSKK